MRGVWSRGDIVGSVDKIPLCLDALYGIEVEIGAISGERGVCDGCRDGVGEDGGAKAL